MISAALCVALAAAPSPLRVGEGPHWVEFGVGLQIRASFRDTFDGKAEALLELRRTRFFLRGSLFDGALTFGSQLSTGPAVPEILDAWLGWSPVRALTLKVGQFKTPFTRYRANTFVALPLTDWSLASFSFGAERQLGAQLEVSAGQGTRWSGVFGVFSGENARAAFSRGLADLFVEPLTNPSDLRAPRLPAALHPELFARVGGETNEGPVKLWAFVSAAWDLAPVRAVDFAVRLAPEVKLQWRDLGLEVVGYAGWAPDGQGVVEAASLGATVEASWRFHPRWLVAGRWSRVDFLTAARADAKARADELLSGRLSAADRARLSTAGQLRAQQEVALCVTVDLLDTWLKLQLETGWVRADGRPQPDELRLRSQLQFSL